MGFVRACLGWSIALLLFASFYNAVSVHFAFIYAAVTAFAYGILHVLYTAAGGKDNSDDE